MRMTALCAAALVAFVATASAAAPVSVSTSARNPATGPQAAPRANPAAKALVVSEGFDDIATLAAAGWTLSNLSAPVGGTSWFQGNATVFPAFDGATTGYIGANFNNTSSTGTINTWLVTPTIAFGRDPQLSFYTRKVSPDAYADRLEVRLCRTMPCTNLGSGPSDVGDFTQLLLSVNPSQVLGVYPTSWTQFLAGIAQGLPRSGQGRIAFRYFVTNAGFSGTASDYIGIDRVTVDDGGAPAYFVGGAVSGLAGGSLELQVTGGEAIAVAADGSFQFSTLFDDAASYAVSVSQQPGAPPQACSVSNGSGTIASADVSNVAVQCLLLRDVAGTVSGLAGGGLALQLNGGNDIAIASNGAYAFTDLLVDGDAYAVTVSAQPTAPNQACTVSNGTGTVAGDVAAVDVQCVTTQYAIGGTASGVLGSGLTLQLNGGGDLAIGVDGAFQFPAALDDGSAYAVTVATQPTGPNQVCSVANGTGALAGADVSSVAVSCVTEQYRIGGSVGGLAGSGLVLQLNGGNDLAIGADGAFEFPVPLDDGSAYAVSVSAQPAAPNQVCTVSSGSGMLAGANVSSVAVSCVTEQYRVGGSVAGLAGSGLVLQLNGGNDLAIAADGAFEFPLDLDDASAYLVSVSTQPGNPVQTCSVANAGGNLAGTDVSDVTVTCATESFSVGGSVSGLAGSGLVLRLNGGQDLAIAADGSFVFAAPLSDGSTYAVTVATQPGAPAQACTVANGSGTLGGSDVTDVGVACTTTLFPVGGTVTGLTVAGLVLRLNGTQDLIVDAADGAFAFTPGLIEGASYLVEIATQPPGLECTLSNGSGIVTTLGNSGISVACATAGGNLPPPTPTAQVIPASDRTTLLLLALLVLGAAAWGWRRNGA